MAINTRAVLIAVANLFALLVVSGVCYQGLLSNSNSSKAASPLSAVVNEPVQLVEPAVDAEIPNTRRELRKKSKGKGSTEEPVDCVPLYPTPAPTKSMKGTKGSRRLKGMNGKGKGSTAAPTVSQSPVSIINALSSSSSLDGNTCLVCALIIFLILTFLRVRVTTVLLFFGRPICLSHCLERSFRLFRSYLRKEQQGQGILWQERRGQERQGQEQGP